jgi:isoleucyl-tRNA synthetase
MKPLQIHVFVRFPVTSGELAELKASLLVWTTTPWTLVSNTAIAVHPEVEYVAMEVTHEETTEVFSCCTEFDGCG